MKKIFLIICMFLGGCASAPKGIEPIANFEVQRYLGTWYEIARLDHSFERGLSRVTADYSLLENGDVRVVNRGFDSVAGSWKSAQGVAKFVRANDIGHLKVSFFGPFYGAYVIFALDSEAYNYALVSGPSRKYLWLLAREPVLADEVSDMLVTRAKQLGFATENLIYVNHE